MSFGGSVAAMIASLKHNARPKRRPFDKDVPVASQTVRSELLREACPEDIERIQREMAVHRRRDRVIIIVGLFLALLFIGWTVSFSMG